MLEQCVVDLDTAACDEFGQRMRELKRLLASIKPIHPLESYVVKESPTTSQVPSLKPVSDHDKSGNGNGIRIDYTQEVQIALQTALAEAERITAEQGIKSPSA